MGRVIIGLAAKEILNQAIQNVRPKFWWQKAYRASLRAGYVVDKVDDYTVVFGDEPKTARSLDADRQLVTFKETTIRGLEPRGDFFRKHSPWPIDLLPNVAGGKYGAKPYVKVVSPSIVIRRRRELRPMMRSLTKTMRKLHVPLKAGKAKLGNRMAFDLEYALLSQEFGRGGKPVWRPIIRQANRILLQAIKDADAGGWGAKVLLNLKYSWNSLKAFGIPKLDPALLPSIVSFQSKLLGRPGGAY